MIDKKSKSNRVANPPWEEDITSFHNDEYMEEEELSLAYETDEEEDNWLTTSQESTGSEDDAELNNILCTTLEKVNKFLSDQTESTFGSSLDGLLANMSPENRSRAENKIWFYLVKCKLHDMTGKDIDDIKI